MNNIHSIFPTPIFKDKIPRSLSEEEKLFFNNIEKRISFGNLTSVNQYLLDSAELKSLKLLIEEKLNEYFYKVYDPEENIEIYITQSWLSYTRPNEHHHKHRHPNSFLSGVFYIDANPQKDKIFFYDKNYKEIVIRPKNYNLWNSDSWYYPVETGDIIIFPSTLEHMVETVEEDDDRKVRISLAFNTFIKGKLGTYGTSTELVI